MGRLPGRTDAIRGGVAVVAGLVLYAGPVLVVQRTPIETGPTELFWDLLATAGVFVAPLVALYYWVAQPHG